MSVETRNVSNTDPIGHKELVLPVTIEDTVTSRFLHLFKPGYPFRLVGLDLSADAYTAEVLMQQYIVGANEVITAGALTVHSVAEQLALALGRYMVNGVYVEKAAETAITFSAAHVVSATKFGIILIQIDSDGVVSSKVPAATQAYDTAAEAEAALPAADAGKLAIHSILIEADAGDWTANTDDLTDASDLTSATITAVAATVNPALDAALEPAAKQTVSATVHSDRARHRGSKTDSLLTVYTADATAVLSGAIATIRIRGMPMAGDGSVKFD